MIYTTNKTYAKVWKITNKGKYADVQISTSRKNKDGKRVYSNWFVSFVGDAFKHLSDIGEGDNIIIEKMGITNEGYEKDGEKKSRMEIVVYQWNREEKQEY